MNDDRGDHLRSLAKLWRAYSTKVYGSYSPLNSALAMSLADSPAVMELVADAPPHAHEPNMLLAATQYIVLGGSDHPLARFYGEFVPGRDDLSSIAVDFILANRDQVSELLTQRHIQTNETGRCGPLALGLTYAASLIGEPLALIDAGASAGLNLAIDDYRIRFGKKGSVGPVDSAVVIETEMRGEKAPVPERLPTIIKRLGIDRDPVDLTVEENVRWLRACIWPGTHRQERAAAAMTMAARRPSLVRVGDMVDALPAAITEMAPSPTVVVTSWSFSYLPPDERDRFREVLRHAGRTAAVAWLYLDGVDTYDLFKIPYRVDPAEMVPSVLGVAVFGPEGTFARPLALIHSHGTWVEWL